MIVRKQCVSDYFIQCLYLPVYLFLFFTAPRTCVSCLLSVLFMSILGEFLCPVLSCPFSSWSPCASLFLLPSLVLSSSLPLHSTEALFAERTCPALRTLHLFELLLTVSRPRLFSIFFLGQLECFYTVHQLLILQELNHFLLYRIQDLWYILINFSHHTKEDIFFYKIFQTVYGRAREMTEGCSHFSQGDEEMYLLQ